MVIKFLEIRVFIVLVMLQVIIATLSKYCMQEDESRINGVCKIKINHVTIKDKNILWNRMSSYIHGGCNMNIRHVNIKDSTPPPKKKSCSNKSTMIGSELGVAIFGQPTPLAWSSEHNMEGAMARSMKHHFNTCVLMGINFYIHKLQI